MEKIVPRGTIEKFEKYRDLLLKWQNAVNLVSPNTLNDLWTRHFIDSAQISGFLPENTKILLDLGTGAGFPGMVLAIMYPEIDVHLVESDDKKCQFLKNVSRETTTPVNIYDTRLEYLTAHGKISFVPDVITARALADLRSLLSFVLPYVEKNPDLVLLFPKGENAEDEITAAREQYSFDVTRHQSITNPKAQILEIGNLKKLPS